MTQPPFPKAELNRRMAALRARMAECRLDLVMVSTPENIFYLTGLDHGGYFWPHLLLVPQDSIPILVGRAMERVSIERQVHHAHFEGHGDEETAADAAIRLMRQGSFARIREIGVESWSAGFAYGFGARLRERLDDRHWHDVTGLVDRLRLIKSPLEQELMRRAAAVSDIAATAAAHAMHDGAHERDIAAECMAAMIRAGGSMPGFGPFIRPIDRLGEEHGSWADGRLRKDEAVFVELSGCVARYHAPLGRLVHLQQPSPADQRMKAIARSAFTAVLGALKPGSLARDVYAAWQAVVDEAGLLSYRRHHCGYCVGIGFPPSWTGGNSVTGLRCDSDLILQENMSFHILSWLLQTGHGDGFCSDTVLLGERGSEVLTTIEFS